MKGQLYEDNYDVIDPDSENQDQDEPATNEGNQALQLTQMEAIIDNLDPTFDRGVLD